jgi:peptide/nickel transport system substrate-binding protein
VIGAARRLAWAALLASTLGGAGCSERAAAESEYLTLAMVTSPNNLDPRVGSDESSQKLHQLLYNSLLKLDHQLRVVPDLAVSIETPDELTYVVHLRQGVRFHDGRQLTAKDVVHTFSSFLDPDFVSPRKGAYRQLASVSERDPQTVVFTLKEPFGSFPINLVMGIVPDGAGAEMGRQPVGTGPYRLESFLPDDRTVLTRFDDYFEGPARNAGLVLKVVPDETMRGLELRKGTADIVINDLSPDVVHRLETEGRIRVTHAPGADYTYIGINLRDQALRDVRVRRAIAHGIDREAIVKHLRRGLATPAVGILPPASWAFDPDLPGFAYDPARARRLLDEAGYPDPDGDGPAPRLRLSLKTSTTEFYRLQAAVIQQDLRRIGIDVEIRSYEFATLYADVLRGNFQLFTLQWVGVTDPDILRRVFHSSQMPPTGFNRGYFADPEVDRLIDAATRRTDDEGRRRLYGEAQRRIAEAVPYVSLWYKANFAAYHASIRGIRLSPIADFTFLKDVERARDAAPTE